MTVQMILVTNTVTTYAILNYGEGNWTKSSQRRMKPFLGFLENSTFFEKSYSGQWTGQVDFYKLHSYIGNTVHIEDDGRRRGKQTISIPGFSFWNDYQDVINIRHSLTNGAFTLPDVAE